MAFPEWISPLTDTVVSCVEVILVGTIVLATIELMRPVLARVSAERRPATREAEGA